jgi:hypothetical protein
VPPQLQKPVVAVSGVAGVQFAVHGTVLGLGQQLGVLHQGTHPRREGEPVDRRAHRTGVASSFLEIMTA